MYLFVGSTNPSAFPVGVKMIGKLSGAGAISRMRQILISTEVYVIVIGSM